MLVHDGDRYGPGDAISLGGGADPTARDYVAVPPKCPDELGVWVVGQEQ